MGGPEIYDPIRAVGGTGPPLHVTLLCVSLKRSEDRIQTKPRTQRRPAGQWRTRTTEEQKAHGLTAAVFRSVVTTS